MARTALPLVVYYDTREQNPFDPIPGVTMQRVSLETGDYTTPILQGIATIDRKSIQDWASWITHGRERADDVIRRMRDYKYKAIIIEGEIGETWRVAGAHPNSVIGTVASFFARADVPCLFAGTRPAAARLTFGLLRRWEERLTAERAEVAGAA